MPTLDLSEIYDAINPHFHWMIEDKNRIQVLVGGGASSKSYTVGQVKIYKALTEERRSLIIRKVGKTIRHSVFDMLCGILKSWDMISLFKVYKTDMMMECLINKNQFIFSGLDDVEKLKSIFDITDIFVEEASEITEADFNQLNIRLRGETKNKKQITLAMNPINKDHWVKKRFFDRVEPDCITDRSTYLDNQFLDKDTKKMLEGIEDPYFKAVYVKGEWGSYGNIVFTNYVVHDFDPDPRRFANVCNGLDFGFEHAQAIVRLGFIDDEIYIFDELHLKRKTNTEFIEIAMEYFGDELKSMPMTADSANPDKITEWQQKGYRVEPAKKGPGSLRYGIEFLVGRRVHIHATNCPKTASEFQSFKRREDKNGDPTEDFVEINDDGIAAARYATEFIWGQYHGELAGYNFDIAGFIGL